MRRALLKNVLLIMIAFGVIGCAHIGGSGALTTYLDQEALSLADQKQYELSLYYIESGHYKSAREKLERLVIDNPNFPDAYNGLGVIHERRGRVTLAADYFLRAIQLNPNYDTAIKNYGVLMCYVTGGDGIISMAKNQYQTMVKSRLYSEAARCYLDNEKYQQATDALNKALQLDTDYADSYLIKAKLDYKLAQYESAESAIFHFNDLNGYTEESLRLALILAEKRGNQADIDRYRNALVEQFQMTK